MGRTVTCFCGAVLRIPDALERTTGRCGACGRVVEPAEQPAADRSDRTGEPPVPEFAPASDSGPVTVDLPPPPAPGADSDPRRPSGAACPRCGAQNPHTRGDCGACGAPLEKRESGGAVPVLAVVFGILSLSGTLWLPFSLAAMFLGARCLGRRRSPGAGLAGVILGGLGLLSHAGSLRTLL